MFGTLQFQSVTQTLGDSSKPHLFSLFPSITVDKFPEENSEVSYELEYENSNFTIKMKRISLKEMAQNSDIIDADGYEGSLIAVYLFDLFIGCTDTFL